MTNRPFRLLIVSHAADRTGAPISTLALTKAWAAHDDVEVKVLLRRDGPIRTGFEAAITPENVRLLRGANIKFSILDAVETLFRGQPILALKGLKNPDRPYTLSRVDRLHLSMLRAELQDWQPDAIYASTTHCGDAIEPLGLSAPILTHVREMKGVIAALDPERREFALQKSTAFAAVSEPVQQTLVDDWGVDPYTISIEPPAIELDTVLKSAEAQAQPHPRAFIIGIGSLIPRKGPDLFLKAAKAAIEAGDPHNFIWLGDGDMRAGLEVQTAALGLSERVVWTGQIENPYPYLKKAKALAMTSREDPHPRTMIEAAALGTPVVAFCGSGGADYFIPENAAGKLVPMGDTIAMSSTLISNDLKPLDPKMIQGKYDVRASAARLLDRLKALAA